MKFELCVGCIVIKSWESFFEIGMTKRKMLKTIVHSHFDGTLYLWFPIQVANRSLTSKEAITSTTLLNKNIYILPCLPHSTLAIPSTSVYNKVRPHLKIHTMHKSMRNKQQTMQTLTAKRTATAAKWALKRPAKRGPQLYATLAAHYAIFIETANGKLELKQQEVWDKHNFCTHSNELRTTRIPDRGRETGEWK